MQKIYYNSFTTFKENCIDTAIITLQSTKIIFQLQHKLILL